MSDLKREMTKAGIRAVLLLALLSSVSYYFFPRTRAGASFYVDDLSVMVDGDRVVLSEGFDSGSLENSGWSSITYYTDTQTGRRYYTAELQKDYYHSPPYALVLHQEGEMVAHAYHDIRIDAGWKTVNYSAWVMVPELEPVFRIINETKVTVDTFTNLYLYSGSSFSNLAGGVYLESFHNNTCRTHIWLFINYQKGGNYQLSQGGVVHNYTVTLIPYRWYRMSLLVDSVSEQVRLYFDQKLVAQLPLNVTLFKTFNAISVWGWIP